MSLVGLPTGPSIACVFRGGSTTRINGSPRTSASLSSDPCSWVWASSTRWRRSPPLPRCFGIFPAVSRCRSAIAHLIGRPLIRLNNRQQAVEADFRFSLVRLREEAEGIALYGGEAQERGIALGRFRTLYDNFKRIILCTNQYLMFQLLFSQGTSSFALLIASPRYFSGAIQLGVLTQIANAFERVNEALSWFIASYVAFAEWRATVDRLTEFAAEIKQETAAAVLGPRTETA